MHYIIILKIRKFHQPTANCFGTARQKPVGEGTMCHIGGQKNAHQPIFPHNIIGNFPTSLATNSAFSGSNDFKFGMETYHMILQVITKFGRN